MCERWGKADVSEKVEGGSVCVGEDRGKIDGMVHEGVYICGCWRECQCVGKVRRNVCVCGEGRNGRYVCDCWLLMWR